MYRLVVVDVVIPFSLLYFSVFQPNSRDSAWHSVLLRLEYTHLNVSPYFCCLVIHFVRKIFVQKDFSWWHQVDWIFVSLFWYQKDFIWGYYYYTEHKRTPVTGTAHAVHTAGLPPKRLYRAWDVG